ncbi:uncharacterized protein K441DRAFT_651284 [Cenococcum geophilum 1.58]|uniref:uncharacterized protein n=1 Tax=Cenococcum geophilum 1.58 TaxID=794803 RepID=UPI00358FD52B|nr:hypothetical protein K441DRAFT_651284 [Cenococcum geophilum 1.58]
MIPNKFYKRLLPLDVSTDGGGEEGQDFPLIKQTDINHSREKHCCRWSRYLSASLTIMGAFLLITAYTIVKPTDLSCARQLSTYSPMVEAVEYYDLDWDNDFWKTSLYMGKPTAEGDEAWDNLWNIGEINIPFDVLHLLNKTLDDMWKLTPPQYGRGVVANFEVFHQLHCLNKIRQYTYLDSYETPPEHFRGTPQMARTHVDHCIESLRIAIMCHGDVTPLLIRHDPSNPLGDVADFSNHHKCRRFDKLVDWMKDHAMSCDGKAC